MTTLPGNTEAAPSRTDNLPPVPPGYELEYVTGTCGGTLAVVSYPCVRVKRGGLFWCFSLKVEEQVIALRCIMRCAWEDEARRLDVPLKQAPGFDAYMLLRKRVPEDSPDRSDAHGKLKTWAVKKQQAVAAAKASVKAWAAWGTARKGL